MSCATVAVRPRGITRGPPKRRRPCEKAEPLRSCVDWMWAARRRRGHVPLRRETLFRRAEGLSCEPQRTLGTPVGMQEWS